eukprot:TCALIF_02064-PA protein Name:"Similar to Hsp67Bb Heat shock protein 67B2 (Drosophila melanogaster)" AED:0.27 eAED:0.27 QI:51/0.5/0.33/1/0.5/0.33/3/0/123
MDFEKVSKGLATGEFVLVDVRGGDERKAKRIPGSQHIPHTSVTLILSSIVPEMDTAMTLGGEEFKAKYGFAKPEKTTHLVVHCLKGGRAAKAASSLKAQGYNAEPYSGSMEDWVARNGPTESG